MKESDDGMGLRSELSVLSLFTGAGGGELATQHLLGFRTVCYVEIDPYCQAVIKARIRDGLLHDAPIWDDVRTFDGRPWRGKVDIVAAGFPCQPFSVAGKQRGADDERNCWPDTIRIIREVGPRFALLENVPGLVRTAYFGEILGDLAEAGFDAEWSTFTADSLGSAIERERLFIVAWTNEIDGKVWMGGEQKWPAKILRRKVLGSVEFWTTPPSRNHRVGDGMANYLERVRAIGNGQVPIVAATAWRLLSGAKGAES